MTRDPIQIWFDRKLAGASRQYIRPAAAALVLGIVSYALPARAEPASFADFPFVIYCEYSGSTRAYYFSRLADGIAVYLTPDRQAGMITIDGSAQRIGGERAGSCLDKTLMDLRAAGQAFDLPH